MGCKMLLIKSGSDNPYFNIASEEYFLKNYSEEVLILYINRPSVIVGKNQNTLGEIDFDFVKKNDIPVVRRLSGGGAVFHDEGNVNFCYIINGGKFGDYAGITGELLAYLKTLKIPARLHGRNDLVVGERKFSGNAQYKWKERLLHHGTILVNSNLERLQSALRVEPGKIASKGIGSVRSRVSNLCEFAAVDALKVRRGFSEYAVRGGARPYSPTGEDTAAIENLVKEKYETWEWNFGYSPKYSFHKKKRFEKGGVEAYLEIEGGRIKNAKLYGDFFSHLDILRLCESLVGLPHRRGEILKKLREINVGDYIFGVSADELIEVLF